MRIRVDRENDALYFRPDETRVVESEEVRPGVISDFDEKDQVVGVEFLKLSYRASHGYHLMHRPHPRIGKQGDNGGSRLPVASGPVLQKPGDKSPGFRRELRLRRAQSGRRTLTAKVR